MVAPAARSPRRPVSGLAAAAHIFVLSALAVAEPLFDLLSRQAEFFIAHDAQPFDLVLLALVLSVGLPAFLLVPVGLITWCHRAAGRCAHLILVAGLSGLVVLQLIKRLAPGAPGGLLVLGAAILGAASAAGYWRWTTLRTFLTFASPVALLSPLLFLFTSPIRQMLLPQAGHRIETPSGTAGGPVVMVILDELPLSSLLDESNQIDPLRYPNLAALAEGAYWFRDATTVSDGTTHSVPIILSGMILDRLRLPLARYYPDNLFTLLADVGYRLNVFETHTKICPPELCSRPVARVGYTERLDAVATDLAVVYLHLLLPADLAVRLPAIDATWRNFAGRTIGTRLRHWLGTAPKAAAAKKRRDNQSLFDMFLKSIDREGQPALHFIHLMLPHVPWRYLPSGREYGPIGAPTLPHGLVQETWGADSWEVVQGYQRHLLQLGYVDSLVGRLRLQLEQQDLYDAALIVLVADHGASFYPEKPRRRLTHENFADILSVPLIVKLPGQKQGVLSERNVETIDILPTIADVLDLGLPGEVDGQSAIDSDLPERRQKFALRSGRWDGHERDAWDVEALRAGRQESVTRKLGLFGSGTRPGGLFRIGRRGDLVGRPASEIGIADPAAATELVTNIELEQTWSFEQVDLDSPFIPAHITGRARFAQPREAPMELAVAINGTVEAVTQTFGHDGRRARFTAMVREAALLAGRNLIEVFEISDRRQGAVLSPTRQLWGEGYTLVATSGEETIHTPLGLRVPLVADDLRGFAKINTGLMGTLLSGWVEIDAGRQAPGNLLVFVDDRLAFATQDGVLPDGRQVGVAKPGHRQASFKIPMPDALVTGSEKIRLFVIQGKAASEIRVGAKVAAPKPGVEAPRREGLIFADGFESGSTRAWN